MQQKILPAMAKLNPSKFDFRLITIVNVGRLGRDLQSAGMLEMMPRKIVSVGLSILLKPQSFE